MAAVVHNDQSGQTFRPGTADVVATQVEISVACRNLIDRDVLSKSDPMCIIYLKELASSNFREIGRTESVKNSLNPDFIKKITMLYHFEESQKLRFEVYDQDSSSNRISDHDFLGRMECTLGEIVAAQGNQVKRKLTGSITGRNDGGMIIVSAEELGTCKELATMQFSGVHLDKKDTFGKSDPFLIFSKCNEDNSFTVVHKTEVIKYTLNPTWRPFTIPVRQLCAGDNDRTIRVECYDWDSDGGHDLIGIFSTNMKTLRQGMTESNVYECINSKKKAKKKGYKNSGTIKLLSIKMEQEYTFLDYIKGGLEMNFTVAVDFTASNGAPHDPRSLHYTNPHQPNQYHVAIRSIGEIIQDYDSDKMFPSLGFGAKIPPRGELSHEFFLNLSPNNPYCAGVDGILQAYQAALYQVQLYGPTNFSPVINHVARFAAASRDGSRYFVLLIITDGEITDMNNTKAAIVQASGLPLSIIIVGVGNEEFSAMEELDGDVVRLSYQGRYAERDIVQFVPLREFLIGGDWHLSQARLAKEVLAEIPGQVVGYMKKRGLNPKPPRPIPVADSSPQTLSPGIAPPPQQQQVAPAAAAMVAPPYQQQQMSPQNYQQPQSNPPYGSHSGQAMYPPQPPSGSQYGGQAINPPKQAPYPPGGGPPSASPGYPNAAAYPVVSCPSAPPP